MAQMPTRPCTRCGMPLAANQRFCTRCGATVDSVSVPGNPLGPPPGGGNFLPGSPPPPMPNAQMPFSPQPWGSQQAPSVPGTPSLSQSAPSVSGTPSFSQPVHAPSLAASQPVQSSAMHVPQMQVQSPLPQQAHAPSLYGMQQVQPHPVAGPHPQASSFAGHPAQPASFQAPSAPAPHGQPPSLPGASSLHTAGSAAARSARHIGMRVLLTKPALIAMAVVVLAGTGAGIAYSAYRASAPTSFVIATDRGSNQIMRIDLATRNMTVLLSNKVLPGSPDSAVFINDTQMLIDFPGNGEIGIGNIQHDTYTSIGKNLGGSLRDMALRPDGSGMLIADTNGTILEYHVDTHKISTFAQNIGGVQGLAFDANGALYAAVGGQVIQLDPASGRQLKPFTLPGGSDGMAYDGHHHTLDLAIGGSIVALDPQTGQTSTLIDGLGTTDGLAIDRQGNLFIADAIGILDLNTSNQLLIVGTNTSGISWDDVAPLSGSGAASY